MALDRRDFITWSAAGAFVLGLRPAAMAGEPVALSPWIKLRPDGRVTLFSTVSEMGQGARTGQAQILADELDVPWDAIDVEMATEDFAHGIVLATGGSASIRRPWQTLRAAAATARAQITTAAAKRWNCSEAECDAALGKVTRRASGASFTYAELAGEAATCAAPASPPFKPLAARRYIGKPISTFENVAKTRGAAVFGIDVRLPGLKHASVRQAPVFGAKLASVDDAPALAVPGVRKVVRLDNAVAVIADNTWAAFKGVRALQPQWTTADKRTSSADIDHQLDAVLGAADADVKPDAATREALRADIAKAARKVEATYQTAYLAHAALEPMNTTVQISADKVEVWSPTQAPSRIRPSVAQALGRPADQVVVHNTLLGGGFGRRLQADYAVLAALVAKEADGAPVQLLWTREEDVSHDWYRKAVRSTYRAGLGPDGLIDGYELIGASTDARTGGAEPKPYDFKRFATTQSNLPTGIPQGPWRSVDEGLAAFGRESFIDECAHAAGQDPLAYRRKLAAANPRALRLLEAVADRIGWTKPKAKGTGRGVALVDAFGSLVATAMEVEVKGKALRVRKVVVAGDLGTAVNPQQVRAQFEGGATMGLSAALAERMSFTSGASDQQNFDAYPLIRMRQVPPIEVVLFDSPEAPVGGAGEPGLPGVAPALANAVFDATGQRIRALPFAAQGYEV